MKTYLIISASPIRSASSWQRLWCETCRDETNHHRNTCVHCGANPISSTTVTVTAQYNGRAALGRLTEIQRTQARQMLNAGTSAKVVAAKLRVSQSAVYRLNPLTRG